MNENALRLEGVSKAYPGGQANVAALSGIDLRVESGEFLIVTGPSGCGKSTLLHIMGAMDTPTSGHVYLGGRELSSLDDAALSRIRLEEVGFVYQFFNLIPTMTAHENVALPLILQKRSRSEVRSRAAAALERVEMGRRLDHFPHQLSGGEMQRVAIARAVVTRPRLILADEPTGNLDSHLGREVLELLAELRREEGFTIVVATHSEMPRAFATREVLLRDGRIAEKLA
ncbi:MAG: ABC transporter ATP-binding protein [Nitrospinota bacterium]